MTNISKGKVTLCLLAVFGWLAPAQAAIESVKVNKTRSYEKAPGYTYAELTINGSVRRSDHSVGAYSVPAVMIYPRNRCGNDVGVVDWLNSAAFYFFPDTGENGTIDFTLAATGTHLFEEGYTYLSIQWDKLLTEKFGPTPPRDGKITTTGLRLHRACRRCVGDPAGRRASAEESEQISGQESSRAGRHCSELGLFAGRRAAAGDADRGTGSQAGLRRPPGAGDRSGAGSAMTQRRTSDASDCGTLPTDGRHAPLMMLVSESDMVAYHGSRTRQEWVLHP